MGMSHFDHEACCAIYSIDTVDNNCRPVDNSNCACPNGLIR